MTDEANRAAEKEQSVLAEPIITEKPADKKSENAQASPAVEVQANAWKGKNAAEIKASKPIHITQTIIPVDNVTKKLFDPQNNAHSYTESGQNVLAGYKYPKAKTRANKNPIYTTVKATLVGQKEFGIKGEKELDLFDKAVLVEIVALHRAGNPTITYAQIYKAIAGDNSKHPSEKIYDVIKNSIRKLIHTYIEMNIQQEIEVLYDKKGGEKEIAAQLRQIAQADGTIRGYLLKADEVDLTFKLPQKGKTEAVEIATDAIMVKSDELSDLYLYAEAKGQVATIGNHIKNVKRLPITKENVMARDYIIEKIIAKKSYVVNATAEAKKNGTVPPRKEKHFLIAELLDAAGVKRADGETAKSWAQRKRVFLGNVTKILEHLQRYKVINSFTRNTEKGVAGRDATTGFTVYFEYDKKLTG